MKKNLLLLCIGMLCILGQASAQSISMSTTNTNGCAPFPVTFNNTSSIGNYTQWNFGDGTPNSFIYNPTHTFNSSGNFNVQMSVFDTTGKGMVFKGSQNTNINVNGMNLYTSGDTVCPGETFSAYLNPNGGNNYSWTFGDGSSSTQQNVTHTYSTPGVDTLKLSVSNNCGGVQHFVRPIYVKAGGHPSAYFSSNGGNVCPNDILQFYPANNSASAYSWTFGDGGTSTQNQPTHSYGATGPFTVTLKLTSSCGTSSTSSNIVNVTGTNYFQNNISINSSYNQACPHDAVNFSFNNNIQALSIVWKFGTTDSIVVLGNNNNNNNQGINYAWATAGTYTVTAKLHNGCNHDTTVSKVMNIKGGLPYTGNVGMQMNPNPVCPNDAVTFYTTTASAYKWYFGNAGHDSSTLASPTFSYPSAATYTVGLKLYNGCGRDTLITSNLVVNNNTPAIVLSHLKGNGNDNWGAPSNTSCAGDTVIFYAMGGMGSLHWSFGDNTTAIGGTPLNFGNQVIYIMKHVYMSNAPFNAKLTVTNSCGNSSSDSLIYTVGGSTPVNGSINIVGQNNNNNNSNTANACQTIVMLGAGGSMYHWHFGNGDSLNTSGAQISYAYKTAGTYTISLRVTNGCGNSATYTQNITINGMNPSLTPTSLLCNASGNGKIIVAVSGGYAPYTYSINGGPYQTSATFNNLSASTYTVTIKDSLACKVSSMTTLTQPTPLVLTPGSVNSTCGNTNGSATANMSGGTLAYTYSWQAGGATATLSAQHSGSYLVTVTDGNGCSVNATIPINDVGGPVVTYVSAQGPYCINASSVTLSGGTPGGGTYTGLGVSGGAFFNPAAAGVGMHIINYTVTSGPCTASASDTLIVYALPHVTAFSSPANGAVCTGGSVTLNGGGASSYSWSGGKSDGLAFVPGSSLTYTVTGTDAHGCSATASTAITVNPYPTVALAFGPGKDTVNICQSNIVFNEGTPSGGTYSGPGVTNNSMNPSSIGRGIYPITYMYTTTSGCAASHTANLHVLPCPLTISLTPTNLVCNGAGNGKITATANGGILPYTYSINGGPYQVSSTFNNLSASSYTVTIKDSAGVTTNSNTTLSQPTALVLAPSSVNSTCTLSNGSATATMSGGTPNYTYSWAAGGSAGTLSAQPSGSYLVTVMDANGCSVNATIPINDNGGPAVTYTGTQGPFCINGGSVALTGGGPGGGTYSGSGVSGPGFFNPAIAGAGVHTINYTVTSGGCTSSATNTVTVNALPHVSAFSVPANEQVCTGGSVTLNGGGATSYSWSGGKTNGVAFVPGGSLTYTVTGTDANNCSATATASIVVNQFPTVTLVFGPGTDSVGDCQSNVLLNEGTPAGGVYSGTGVTAANKYSGAVAGIGVYTITYSYTNAGGCMASNTASLHVIPCPTGVVNLAVPVMKIYPNPNNGIFTVETPDQTGTLLVMDVMGQLIYSERITQPSSVLNLQNHPNGMYLVKIEGANGIAVQRIFVVK
jgi:PKD repeat protein